MIYSGSSFEFSEFGIRIQAKVPDADPDPNYIYLVYFEIIQEHPLNSIKKKKHYLPFSIQYYCPIVKTVQNSHFYNFIYMLFHF